MIQTNVIPGENWRKWHDRFWSSIVWCSIEQSGTWNQTNQPRPSCPCYFWFIEEFPRILESWSEKDEICLANQISQLFLLSNTRSKLICRLYWIRYSFSILLLSMLIQRYLYSIFPTFDLYLPFNYQFFWNLGGFLCYFDTICYTRLSHFIAFRNA